MSDVFDQAIARVLRVLRATPTVANTRDEVEQLITAVGRVHRTLMAP